MNVCAQDLGENPWMLDRVRQLFGRVSVGAAVPDVIVALIVIVTVMVLVREFEHRLRAHDGLMERTERWGMIVFIRLFAVAGEEHELGGFFWEKPTLGANYGQPRGIGPLL